MGGNLVETLIGAVVLVVAGVFLLFAYSTADLGTVDGYQLTAKFERIDGISVGDDVRMSGIKVGTVSSQHLDMETFLAVLNLNIDDGVELPDDTSIKVASEGLLGGSYLSIEPGGGEELLKSGDEIKYTQGSVNLMDLIGQAIFSGGGQGDNKQ